MKRLLLPILLIVGTTAAPSLFAAEAAASATKVDPTKGQQIVSTVCVACHAADGNSTISANPKLAAQHPEYLLKQMKNFKANGDKQPERVNPVMNGMIAAYNEEQMRDIAAFLSTQKLNPEVAKNRDTIEFGQQIYRAGNESKGLPACSGCHGPAGAGIPGQFPRLGGQFAEYIESQLKAFREGAQVPAANDKARTNDPAKMMRMIAVKMTDAEIRAVSDYVAGLR